MSKILKFLKGLLSTIISIILVIMVALVGYLSYCNATNNVAYVGNYSMMQIVSPSMEPNLPVGGYILAQKYTNQDIKIGDVIAFYSTSESIEGKLNTHRVIKVVDNNGQKEYITKGDNNAIEDDAPVKQNEISGIYIKNLPFVTKVAKAFMNKSVFFIAIIVPALVLIAIIVYDVFKKVNEIKKENLIEEEVKRLKENDKKNNGE